MRRKKYLEMRITYKENIYTKIGNTCFKEHNSFFQPDNILIIDDKTVYNFENYMYEVEKLVSSNDFFSQCVRIEVEKKEYLDKYEGKWIEGDREKRILLENYRDNLYLFDSPDYLNDEVDLPIWLQKMIFKLYNFYDGYDNKYKLREKKDYPERNIILNVLIDFYPFELNLENWVCSRLFRYDNLRVYYEPDIYLFSYYEDEKPA